ncbi:hypothetical protein AQUCO_03700215v1 [Aquilegia coerulea]|uniref:Pentacotripeptide-repeat region of PRORP domain-containing protein n=1 Tax=Aquilegia coerulea TaxID=218851 RepID=A0A2G5CU23_AQUCA|nr:hypothetical protein AQUCO_03700215v1 [Aquilegia coerulea]
MAAQLRQSKYSDLLSLHRFITQAGVAANIVTHNLLINAYCDCRKTDTALEHYNQLIKNAPFNPSPTTYRILVKGLIDNSKVEKAIEIKDDMLVKGLVADPIVYNYVMLGLVKEGDGDRALAVYEELKEKLGGFVSDGVVYGNLMKAYFLKGMEKEAMDCYADAVGENTSIKMGAVAYNFVLQALIKNGKFDEALKLFDRIMGEHNPPMKMKVNLGTFNVMADGFCELGRFKEAIEVFRKMGEKRCSPDTLSYNNLIEKLCKNGMVTEAEELQREMGEGNKPDEFTYILLMDACFEQNRADAAAEYFAKMVEADLKPNLNSYNKAVDGLIKAGKVVEANGIFSQMIERLKLEAANYEVMVRALCEASKLDELLELVGKMVRDEKVGLSSEMDEVVRDALRKEGREEDLVRVFEEKEREDREKAEALAQKERTEAAAAAAKAAALSSFSFSSLMPGAKTADASTASGETISVNGNTPIGIQEGTGEATSANASPAVDVVEEAIEVNAEAVSADGSPAVDVVEEAIEVNDLNKESKTSNEGVDEQITV